MSMDILYHKNLHSIGTLSLRPLKIDEDLSSICQWVKQPNAHFWGMQNMSDEEIYTTYRDFQESLDTDVYIGLHNNRLAFLMESYDPLSNEIAELYPAQITDRGMHFFIGAAAESIHNFSFAVISVIVDFLLTQPKIKRVIVEPDIHNEKIHILNKRIGFRYFNIAKLKHKTACLAFCDKPAFQAAIMPEIQLWSASHAVF